jgi:hypothetical protein
LRGAVFGGQHHFARLQAHALAAFQAFQDAFGLFAPVGDDFGELFEQRLGHGEGNGLNRRLSDEIKQFLISLSIIC